MSMMLKEKEIKELNEDGVCITCKGEWTLLSEMERYCERCATHIIIIEDEVYKTEW